MSDVPDAGHAVNLGRSAALFAWLRGAAGVDRPELRRLEELVLDRFASDRHRYSEILELSCSWDASRARMYRFSYGFPGLREERADVEARVLALCRPFGDAAARAGEVILRAARSAAVEQILFGYADDGVGARVKLYLQFRAVLGADDVAREITARMLGVGVADLPAGAPLHMLGLDVGARGLAGAKLYLAEGNMPRDAIEPRFGPSAVVSRLASLGAPGLVDALAIHRLDGPDTRRARVTDIDFSLPRSGLRWQDLAAAPAVARELFTSFQLAARRFSFAVNGVDRATLYYTLAEDEVREEALRGP